VESALGTTPEPSAIGSVGSNIGLVDGSAEWRKQEVMHQRYVRWTAAGSPQASILGYW
jgi:hypothetical protein